MKAVGLAVYRKSCWRKIATSLVERGWALKLLLPSIPLSAIMAEQMPVKLLQHVRFEIRIFRGGSHGKSLGLTSCT